LCADFAGPLFKPAEYLDPLLIRVLVGDAGSQRLHIVDRHDTSVDEPGIRGLEPLFWRKLAFVWCLTVWIAH